MRIAPEDRFWVVTNPTPESTLADVCFQTDLAGLRRQFAGGLTMEEHPTLFLDGDEARQEAERRLVVRRIIERVRLDRGVAADEVFRVTLHDQDGRVLFQGEVR